MATPRNPETGRIFRSTTTPRAPLASSTSAGSIIANTRVTRSASAPTSHGLSTLPPSITSDIQAVTLPVLRHRLIANFNAEADGVTTDDLIERLIAHVSVEAGADREADAVLQ